MNRRDFIRLSSGTLAASYLSPFAHGRADALAEKLRNGPARIVPVVPGEGAEKLVEVVRSWDGNFCRMKLINHGKQGFRIKEVVVCDMSHDLPDETGLYGESFQMLSQSGGTLGHPVDLGYSEVKHYRILQPSDAWAVSGLVTLSPPGRRPLLLGFASCRRFAGRFFLRKASIQAVMDTEGLEIAPGETWEMEEFMLAEGNRPDLLGELASRIAKNHPKRIFQPAPTGWCSWYCFGARVTADQVLGNLDVISQKLPRLKYVQIDDGYQAAMGDWLETGKAFGGDVIKVLKEIRKRGFEPAIWVAPFVAEQSSHIFQQHPEWFIQDVVDGKPLVSSQVTFGGWRHGPWYALDGTHPHVQQHFEEVFRTMSRDWGCTYFKLDANFWGAMHGGRFHDPRATRIQAYRQGMEAIRRGAGNSFILGCNHPIWPSFGLIDGSRSSGDIKRTWQNFRSQARQTLNRNWQNGRLWWNDPDAVLLTGDLADQEFQFHATATYASGGMVLSGDDLTKISPERLAVLQKLLPPTGVAAEFENEAMQAGFIKLPGKLMVCLFNWDDAPATVSFQFSGSRQIRDYWSGMDLGQHRGVFEIKDMPPHSARLLTCQ